MRGRALVVGVVLTWAGSVVARAATPGPFLLGADVSLAPEIERAGVGFKDGGKPTDIFAIFRVHGANCIRLRLFVQPNGKNGVVNDLVYTLALAKRIKAAGLIFSLDLHYSDTWADPGHQSIPAAWSALPFPALVEQVRAYTAQSLRAFREAGVTPDVVQLGNEITSGMLWPIGGLSDKSVPEATRFDRLAALLKAGADGVHDGTLGGAMPRLMIHVDKAQDRGRSQWIFDALTRRGVPFDMIGLSYYPFYKGSFDQVRETLQFVARTYHKPVAIVETAYPFADTQGTGQTAGNGLAWPLTPQGQHDYLQALIRLVRETPDGLGAGVLYWYPESVPVNSPAVDRWYGGQTAMFDHQGNALPAFDAFSQK